MSGLVGVMNRVLEMKTPTLSLLVLRVADVEASLRFYSALGFVFVREQHGSGLLHHSCETGNVVIEIYPIKAGAVQESKAADATMIGFTVVDLDATLNTLHDSNQRETPTPKVADWGRWVNVSNPDGRVVQLTEVIV